MVLPMQNMNEKDLRDMMCVIGYALRRRTVGEETLAAMNLPGMERQAARHSLRAALAAGLPAQALTDTLKRARDVALRRAILYAEERRRMTETLETAGIWYMPMKGAVLSSLYPTFGMREMSDTDILFDRTRAADVRRIFSDHGYKTVVYGKSHHDVYQKKPIFDFEMHRYLVPKNDRVWFDYYKNVKPRLIPERDGGFAYRFTDEDFYTYLIVHVKKHYDGAGTGLRILTDIRVFTDTHPGLDREKLTDAMRQLHLTDFERTLLPLSQKLFDPAEPPLSEQEQTLFLRLGFGGTYGNMEVFVDNELVKTADKDGAYTDRNKRRYVLSRLIPPMSYYETSLPFLYRHRIFIPFYLVFRFFRALILRPGKMLREWRSVRRAGTSGKEES